ncbi:hypothetical protein ACLB2K_043948 [Fragaria x ananassa]
MIKSATGNGHLNSCAARRDVCGGVEVHGRVVKTGFGVCVPVGNALIDMYMRNAGDWGMHGSGDVDSARNVFDRMPERNS